MGEELARDKLRSKAPGVTSKTAPLRQLIRYWEAGDRGVLARTPAAKGLGRGRGHALGEAHAPP